MYLHRRGPDGAVADGGAPIRPWANPASSEKFSIVTTSASGEIGLPARPSAACSRRIAGLSPRNARITSSAASPGTSCDALRDDRIPRPFHIAYTVKVYIDYDMQRC
jgi:hypothetical protein